MNFPTDAQPHLDTLTEYSDPNLRFEGLLTLEAKAKSWSPPKKYAAFAEDPLVKNWLADYKANNTKTESCKRLARLMAGISMTSEQVLAEVKAGHGRIVKERVKEYCRALEAEGKTAMASLILQSFRSFLVSHEVGNMVNWSKRDIIPILAVRTQRRPPKREEIYPLRDLNRYSNRFFFQTESPPMRGLLVPPRTHEG